MALDATTRLSIAEFAIYLVLAPIVVYILIRHGKAGYLGWAFIIVFCGLRLESGGIPIGHHNNPLSSSSGAIINSIGIIHEWFVCFLPLSSSIPSSAFSNNPPRNGYHHIPRHDRKKSFIIQLVFHLMTSGGVALAAVGGSKLAKPETVKNSHATDKALRRVGSAMLFASAVLLVVYALHTYHRLKTSSLPRAQFNSNALGLLYFIMLSALPFTVIRATYSIVYAFDTSRRLKPVTGVFAVKSVLTFLVQLLAVLALISGGIMTRNIRLEDSSIRISGAGGHVSVTSSEPSPGNPGEQRMMSDHGVAHDQHAKNLGSEDRDGV